MATPAINCSDTTISSRPNLESFQIDIFSNRRQRGIVDSDTID
jgi:hypothetical protein